jgi:hypothetical protein
VVCATASVERDRAAPATRTTAFAVSPRRFAPSQRRRSKRPDRARSESALAIGIAQIREHQSPPARTACRNEVALRALALSSRPGRPGACCFRVNPALAAGGPGRMSALVHCPGCERQPRPARRVLPPRRRRQARRCRTIAPSSTRSPRRGSRGDRIRRRLSHEPGARPVLVGGGVAWSWAGALPACRSAAPGLP